MWISALVLIVACANVASLMLVRATGRKLQTSIRAALGCADFRDKSGKHHGKRLAILLGGIAGVVLAM